MFSINLDIKSKFYWPKIKSTSRISVLDICSKNKYHSFTYWKLWIFFNTIKRWLEGNLCNFHKQKEVNLKIFDSLMSELIDKKRVKNSFLENLFCSLCHEVVVNPLMASHVLSKGHFAKTVRLVRKSFYFFKFLMFMLRKKWRKSWNTQDH